MLTYKQVAEELGIPQGTLNRKVVEYNRKVLGLQIEGEPIHNDGVEDHGNYQIYLFKPESVARIREALSALKTRGRGRPANPKPQTKGVAA